MRKGGKDVRLSSDVPREALERISMFDYESGKEGDVLWTNQGGYVPAELPTGDSEDSVSIEEIGGEVGPRAGMEGFPPPGRDRSLEVKEEQDVEMDTSDVEMHPPLPSTSEGRLAGAASSASSGKSRTSEMKEASGRASSSNPAKFLEQEESLKVRDPTFREAAGDYTLDPKKAGEIMDKHLQYLKTKREEIRERSVKPKGVLINLPRKGRPCHRRRQKNLRWS